jgi:hypothetical protein
MRIVVTASLLSLTLVACSADRALAPAPKPLTPSVGAPIDLSGTGLTRLYQSIALAINDSGVIVGYVQATATDRSVAAVWRPPDYRVTILPDLGTGSSVAASIGNDETIGGRICEDANSSFPCHPAYWHAGALHQLAGIGQVNDVCTCDGHTLVGHLLVNGADHGVIWEDDIAIDVGVPVGQSSVDLVAVAHGNIVATAFHGVAEGDSAFERQLRPFRWAPTTGWVSMGFTETGVFDVNSQGTAVGGFSVIWPNGSNQPSNIPGEGLPFKINDRGVVGGSCVPNPTGADLPFFPCEWSSATGWYAISDDTAGEFEGLNNLNQAVGWTYADGRSFAVLWNP